MWDLTDIASIAFYSLFCGFWLCFGVLLAIGLVAVVFNLGDEPWIG